MDHRWGVFALMFIVRCFIVRCYTTTETLDQYCDRAFKNVSFRQCCDIPRFLPDDVIELCRRRPLPPVPPGIPEPIPENCIAECSLNVTRVLMDHRFRVEQARKVLLARTANDTAWKQTISNAIDKCYRKEVVDSFYVQQLAQNTISTQCLPSSVQFLECTFAMTYRKCPVEHWNDPNKSCFFLVNPLNSCRFFFRGKVDALE